MDKLPKDPNILYSAINMLLRDEEFDNLDQLCYAFDADRNMLEAKLDAAGFEYFEDGRCFRAKQY